MDNFEERKQSARDISKANRLYHDKIAERYNLDPRVKYGLSSANCRLRYRSVIEHLPEKERMTSLNIGCGVGNLLIDDREFFRLSIGMDISLGMLRQVVAGGVTRVEGDGQEIPLRSGSVNFISCIGTLHHIYDHKTFFSEVVRVLAPGGLFYSDYDPNLLFFNAVRRHRLLRLGLSIFKKVSDWVLEGSKNGSGGLDNSELRRKAEYYDETVPGLDPEELTKAAGKAGLIDVEAIVHLDAPDINKPLDGRLLHQTVSSVLYLMGHRDLKERGKLLTLTARKPSTGTDREQSGVPDEVRIKQVEDQDE